eukprot:1150926-Pelagomonas_calceolata.AAC.4
MEAESMRVRMFVVCPNDPVSAPSILLAPASCCVAWCGPSGWLLLRFPHVPAAQSAFFCPKYCIYMLHAAPACKNLQGQASMQNFARIARIALKGRMLFKNA